MKDPNTPEGQRKAANLRAGADKARAAYMRSAAEKATEDPVKLARAARIVRVALARQKLTVDELIDSNGPGAA